MKSNKISAKKEHFRLTRLHLSLASRRSHRFSVVWGNNRDWMNTEEEEQNNKKWNTEKNYDSDRWTETVRTLGCQLRRYSINLFGSPKEQIRRADNNEGHGRELSAIWLLPWMSLAISQNNVRTSQTDRQTNKQTDRQTVTHATSIHCWTRRYKRGSNGDIVGGWSDNKHSVGGVWPDRETDRQTVTNERYG